MSHGEISAIPRDPGNLVLTEGIPLENMVFQGSSQMGCRKIAHASSLVAFLGGAMTVALATAPDDRKPNEVSRMVKEHTVKGIKLTVSFLPQYQAGREAPVQIHLTNHSKSTIKYGCRTSVLLGFQLRVEDIEGNQVPLTMWGKVVLGAEGESGRYIIADLRPDAALKLSVNLARYFDLTVPGKYRASFIWAAEPPNFSGQGVTLKLERMEFEIVEPQ